MNRLSPTSESELADIIRDARARKRRLAIEGGGTKAAFGRPVAADDILSTRALAGVTLHEPAEMVLSARAGTPLREIEDLLAGASQILPFEPMDMRPLLGSEGEPTIGALAACNLSGPRRVASGAARDHLIGLRLANGEGEIIKSGGRVMKNVTGLDLVKLNAGAHGTLGVLTEVTFKLLPAPRAVGSLVFEGLEDARAIACLCAAMGSPYEVSGAAHLPKGVGGDTERTILRVEHFPDSVDYRLGRLAAALAEFGAPRRVETDEAISLWRDIRDVGPLVEPRESAIWKISVAPTRGPAVAARVASRIEARWFFDWSGGLIWMATDATGDCGAAAVRDALVEGGHATLVRAPAEARARLDVFQPLAAPLMKLTRGIKASFDPDGVLNPGRMYAGV